MVRIWKISPRTNRQQEVIRPRIRMQLFRSSRGRSSRSSLRISLNTKRIFSSSSILMRFMINSWRYLMREKLCTVKWTKKRSYDRVKKDRTATPDLVFRPKTNSKRTQVLAQLQEGIISKLPSSSRIFILTAANNSQTISKPQSQSKTHNTSSMWLTIVIRITFLIVETLPKNLVLEEDLIPKTIRAQDKILRTVLATTKVHKNP